MGSLQPSRRPAVLESSAQAESGLRRVLTDWLRGPRPGRAPWAVRAAGGAEDFWLERWETSHGIRAALGAEGWEGPASPAPLLRLGERVEQAQEELRQG